MKLTFKIHFRTDSGQWLFLCGNHPALGDGDPAKAVPLQHAGADIWRVSLELSDRSITGPVPYQYILRQADGTFEMDVARGRAIEPGWKELPAVTVVDSWNAPGSVENVFYTEPFRQVLLRRPPEVIPYSSTFPRVTHEFRVRAPLLGPGQTLCLLGGSSWLGQWNTGSPILLERAASSDFFSVELDLTGEPPPVEYKYGVFDWRASRFLQFEGGENRRCSEAARAGELTVVDDGFARLPPPHWRGAGVAIPVFSLRSENSFGIGEFLDLKPLADWAKNAGLKLIQILPVNDTTTTHMWMDSYPYSAISAFALHPVYLNLAAVAGDKNHPLLKKLEPERRRLNALDAVDYEPVARAKLDFLKQIFPSQRAAIFKRADFKEFFGQNEHWLVPYAIFCHLRDKFGTADFSRWLKHRRYDAATAKLADERSPVYKEIALHYFIQFHLHLQLKDAVEHLHANGVILKGDIPIGVSRHSADAWQHPELFHMDMQAGAPPDAFAVKGQNWGFPTYNWPVMKQDGFAWWRHRFEQMGRYFDAFRIDHILGFFRIWSIPASAVEGILGHFVPALPVDVEEFTSREVPFDRRRFLKPWITEAILREIFDTDADEVKRIFLDADGVDLYSLKPEFSTQRQIEDHFAALPPGPRHEKMKIGLFDVVSNIILFESEHSDGKKFHFRLGMEGTRSVRDLPARVQAQLGELYVDYFFRRQDVAWKSEATQKLPALKRATNMLVCGEDLGMVPACVPDTMKQLGLLSLEIQRMPKRLGQEFSRPAEAPYLSVVTPGTHDMSTIRGWWQEDPVFSQKFFNQELGWPGPAPVECEPRIVRAVVRQHLESPAMWSIIQLQDLLGMDEALRRPDIDAERINVPANPRFYWRYRMHLTLEKLRAAGEFNQELRKLIRDSGR
jgi:4-alpha-glucanotransferase